MRGIWSFYGRTHIHLHPTSRPLGQYPRVLQEGRARSTLTLLAGSWAKPPCLSPPKSRMDPCHVPRALKPSADTIKPLRAAGVLLGTRHQPGRVTQGGGTGGTTHQELQHFLGVRVHFNDLLVKGRDLGMEERKTQFDKDLQPCPCCPWAVLTHPLLSHPTTNKILMPIVGKGSRNKISQEDLGGVQLSCQNTVTSHLAVERPPHREKSLFYSKSLETQGLTSSNAKAAERSWGRLHNCTGPSGHQQHSRLSCDLSP